MPTSHLPAFEQIKTFVKAQITSGVWQSGDTVPSETALQQQFGVSRMTVNRAVKELAAEGLVPGCAARARWWRSGTAYRACWRCATSMKK